MCGIGAVILKQGNNAPELAVKLMRAQQSRGTSSSGIAWVSQGEVKVKKELVPPSQFRTWANSNVAICHNRMPSVGVVKIENAHPFISCDKTFAFIHNGTVLNYVLIKKLLNGRHTWQGETDSEVLMHCLEELRQKMPMEQAMELLGERCIVLFKNGEVWANGDLYIGEDEKGIYIANEIQAIRTVSENAKIWKFNGPAKVSECRITFYGRYNEISKEGKKGGFKWIFPILSRHKEEEKEEDLWTPTSEEEEEWEEYNRWFMRKEEFWRLYGYG
jgi:glutamine phosphoribosylpyrophosphate amidotransferase